MGLRKACWISAAKLGRGSGDEADRCWFGDTALSGGLAMLVCRDACGVVCSLPAVANAESTGVVGSISVGDSVLSISIDVGGGATI